MNKIAILVAIVALASFGCDSGSGGTGGTGGAGSALAVTIQFAAKVGMDDFVCGDTYDNLGVNNDDSLQLSDFRLYVQEVELKNADGDYVAVALTSDENPWQTGNVTLLDFEDGCNDTGTPEMNTVVTGTVPTGTYDGLRFKMGVPLDLNHDNPATAEPPLNLSTMQWNWQGGYKFLRLDSGTFSMTDWRMHLGSTGCDGDPVAGGTTMCDNANRTAVEFASFDPAADTVVADFESLVDGAELDVNQSETPFGCMAGPTDGDCAPLFDKLGLPFDGSEPAPQQFFSVE
jgi:uncharacterized repeat protein (TIGR04052 family)